MRTLTIASMPLIAVLPRAALASCEPGFEPTFAPPDGMNHAVQALCVYDDPIHGRSLFVGGAFTLAGGQKTNHIARWTGSGFEPLGDGTSGPVNALTVFRNEVGTDVLYVGGDFQHADGVLCRNIATWNGAQWSALATGSGTNGQIHALQAFDDGSGGGEKLYIGGSFSSVGGISGIFNIGRWTGEQYDPFQPGSMSHMVHALEVFNDGDSTNLYAAGHFTVAGGTPANRVAMLNGSSWLPLDSGTDGPVFALAATEADSPLGAALFAAGFFTTAGGVAASNVAMWDGTKWSPLGPGVNDQVRALAIYDDGSGEALFVGGFFTMAGGAPASRIARWDGRKWSSLGTGITDDDLVAYVDDMRGFDDGGGSSLFVGGVFDTSGYVSADFLARYRGCAEIGPCPGDADGDHAVGFNDLNILLGMYGAFGTNLPADFDGDNDVDFADLNTLLSNYGLEC